MSNSAENAPRPRSREWSTFLIFTLVLLPALTVAFVGGFGFVVWTSHMIYDPPSVSFEPADTASFADDHGPSAAPSDGAN